MTLDLDLSTPVHVDSIDGLRVVWAPAPGPRSHAGLAFRVGQADETLTTRGITHLLEHLVLADTEVAVDHNGETDLVTTTFTVSGTLDEIDAHLARVAATLVSLPHERIDVEKQILNAEEEGRGRSLIGLLALYRYGAQGIGLSGYPEWGLPRLDAQMLESWARQYFTAENAVLVVVGPQRPTAVSWRLPAGQAMPVPESAAAPSQLPSFAFERVAGPSLIAELPRTTAAAAFAAVLDRELMRHVRGERGLAYTAAAGRVVVGADRQLLVAHTDAVPGGGGAAARAFLDVLFALAADGPDAQVLADVVRAQLTALDDPQIVPSLAWTTGRALLFGEPVPDGALAREYEELTPEDVRKVAAEVARTAMVLLPREATSIGRGGFTPQRPLDGDPVEGQHFPVPTAAGEVPVEVVIGVDGVTRVRGGDVVTVRFRDVVGLLRRSDGGRTLIAASGDAITLDPSVVGAARIDLVDLGAGADRWIDEPGSAGGAPTSAASAAASSATPSSVPSTPAASPSIGRTSAPYEPAPSVAPRAPLTRSQRFVVRPLRAVGVAFVTFVVFALLWPVGADEALVPPGDLLLFLLPLLVATADNVFYARRARRNNAAEAAHRAMQDEPAFEAAAHTPNQRIGARA